MFRSLNLSLFTMLAMAIGCSDEDVDNPVDADASSDFEVSMSVVLEGLPDISPDLVYEGWAIVEDVPPISTGRFNSSGAPSQTFDQTFTVPATPTAYILTIEPAVGDDPAPADTHLVGGELVNGSASLTISHPAALGDDFTSAAGTFILATPTSAAIDDDNLGIWFLDPSSGTTKVASLTLPTLPPGWVYEGWIVDANGPISTGTFTDAGGADSDGAGPTSEMPPAELPLFPGQDFIDPPLDLTGGGVRTAITIEPQPDDGPGPFQLKPLIQLIDPLRVGGMMPQTMTNEIANNTVTGSVTTVQ